MRLVIGIPTFQRSQLLDLALKSIESQAASSMIHVLIVDNDPDCSAREVAERAWAMPVFYYSEPRPGVVHVRNRILTEAQHLSAEAIIFVDDDEEVSAEWLQALLRMHNEFPHAVLGGPVHYVWDEKTRPSRLQLMTMKPQNWGNGDRISTTGCGNSFIPITSLRLLESPYFDEDFSLSGGEDTEFFSRITASGGEIRWCADAYVYEFVPITRTTRSSVIKKIARAGFINGVLARRDHGRFIVAIGSLMRILVGMVQILAGVMDKELRTRGLIRLYGGLGRAKASLGLSLVDYGNRKA